MALKTVRGRTSLIGQGSVTDIPITLNAEDLIGSIIYGDDTNLYYSDGIGWNIIGDGTQGSQGIQGIQGIQGSQGLQGTYGPSLVIIGSVLDVSNFTPPDNEQTVLNTAFPSAVAGNGVIDEASRNFWVYDGVVWKNVGQVVGPQGTQGTTGAGFQGIQGNVGPLGPLGNQGIQGTGGGFGTSGIQGTVGGQGVQGRQGKTGVGIEGPTGAQGLRGPQGIQGIQGLEGSQGLQGLQGLQGVQGVQGVQGNFGSSIIIIGNIATANDAALKAAFPSSVSGNAVLAIDTGALWAYTGSFWINIGQFEGPQGIQGRLGSQGITGFQGIQGVLGIQGAVAPGPQGIQGIRGPAGQQGIQGNLGRQGISGVSGFGIQGIQGIQGNLGRQGISGVSGFGIQGVQGKEGAQGNLGRQGISGVTGFGIQGVQGKEGTQGNLGRQGISGVTGEGTQGRQGTSGAPGAQGNLGRQGISGVTGEGLPGSQGIQGKEGVQGSLGRQGISGVTGEGLPGSQGIQGTLGPAGSKAGIPYQFSTSTLDADPGTGIVRFSSAVSAFASSFIYIDNASLDGVTRTNWYQSWDDSTTVSNKGYLTLESNTSAQTCIFLITGAIIQATGYIKVPVAAVSGSIPANGTPFFIEFSRTGDIGTQGIEGFPSGFKYSFSTDITDTQPANGVVKFNSAIAPSVNFIYIDNIDLNAIITSGFIRTLSDGLLRISYRAVPPSTVATFPSVFRITGPTVLAAGSGYYKIPVAYVTGSNTGTAGLNNGTTVYIDYGGGGGTVSPSSNLQANSVGVGTTASGTTGTLRATGEITAFFSDQRLKTDIETIAGASDKIKSISGVYYRNNELAKAFGFTKSERQVGVLAQDIEKVLPESIRPAPFDMTSEDKSRTGENYLTVKYELLVPLLIESLKDALNRIEKLENDR